MRNSQFLVTRSSKTKINSNYYNHVFLKIIYVQEIKKKNVNLHRFVHIFYVVIFIC